MITIDTWIVMKVENDTVTVVCPFMQNAAMSVRKEEIGECNVGDIFSTQTGTGGSWNIRRLMT